MIVVPYLQDEAFLKIFDAERKKEQFIRISVLDFSTETILASIEGKATGGSCNLSGTSNMRRAASCSLVVDPEGIKVVGYDDPQQYSNITEVENLISLNKKIKMDIGFINYTNKYPDYKKIWFPLGIYVAKNCSVSRNNSGINLSLTLNDKCALLNGTMGGVIPADTIFSEIENIEMDGVTKTVSKILIKDIIKSLVTEFGGEDPAKVIVSDIDDYILKVMKWNGDQPVYLVEQEKIKRLVLTDPNSLGSSFTKGDNIGYVAEPFTYPGTLECSAGETVAAMLDKIKNILGNFEWFYDVHGFFHFQQIKNYLNESLSTELIEISGENYFSYSNKTNSVYTFDDSNKHLITSISNSPEYDNIKNDFVVWGSRKTPSGGSKPIRYHLSFADKPDVNENNKRLAIVYNDYSGLQRIIPEYMISSMAVYESLPLSISNEDKNKYFISKNSSGKPTVFKYNSNSGSFVSIPDYIPCYLTTDDWRAELYYLGLYADNTKFVTHPYAAELNAEWPKIWDCKKEKQKTESNGLDVYKGGYIDGLSSYDYDYWLDFLSGVEDSSQPISQFNIFKIGRRTKVVIDKNINCLMAPPFPGYIYVKADGDVSEDIKAAENWSSNEVIQVSEDVYNKLIIGGNLNSAFDKIKDLIVTHTQYNESVSLSVIPIYHLEPNTRISIYDSKTAVSGDYLIKSISLPLTPNGTSNISAVRCIEKTI